MIRRHVSAALVAFTAVLATCLARPLFAGAPELVLLPAAAAASLAIVLLGSEPERVRRAGVLAFGACAGLVLGFVLLQRMEIGQLRSAPPMSLSQISRFAGSLRQDSVLSRDSRTLLRVSLSSASSRMGVTASARGNALVVMEGDYRFSLGQELEFHSTLKPFSGEGSESYVSFVRRDEVRSMGYSRALWAGRARLREEAHNALSRLGFPASALLEALLLGSREDIPADLADGFRKTGSLHILALSGLHAGIVYAFIAFLLRALKNRTVKFLLATAVLAFYQFLAGPIPSLVRATLMLVTAGIALLLDRDAEPLNLLSIAGLLILVMGPYQAWSLSFQLSLLAMLGILAVSPLLSRPFQGRLPPALLSPLAMAASAQLATLPIAVLAFGVYYPSGLLAGLALVPLTTILLWIGLLWLVLSPIFGPALQGAAGWAANGVYALVSETARFFSAVPGISVAEDAAPWVAGISALALLAFCIFPLAHARKRAAIRLERAAS
jgi:ComEC/Rec2-related protein